MVVAIVCTEVDQTIVCFRSPSCLHMRSYGFRGKVNLVPHVRRRVTLFAR